MTNSRSNSVPAPIHQPFCLTHWTTPPRVVSALFGIFEFWCSPVKIITDPTRSFEAKIFNYCRVRLYNTIDQTDYLKQTLRASETYSHSLTSCVPCGHGVWRTAAADVSSRPRRSAATACHNTTQMGPVSHAQLHSGISDTCSNVTSSACLRSASASSNRSATSCASARR